MDRRIIFLASTYVVLGMVKVPLAFPHIEHSFGSQVNIVKTCPILLIDPPMLLL